jgi:hypothetical protein
MVEYRTSAHAVFDIKYHISARQAWISALEAGLILRSLPAIPLNRF